MENEVKPYRCPICDGTGKVPNGFYNQTNGYWSTTNTTPEICRTCHGTGIVWNDTIKHLFDGLKDNSLKI